MSRRPAGRSRRFRRTEGRRRRLWLLPLAAILVLAALWAGGFLHYIATLPLPGERAGTDADAAVVLTGGAERLNEGLNLLGRGQVRRLLVSGVHPDVNKAALGEVAGRTDLLECCVDLGFDARNTEENAREIAEWAHAHGYGSLRVVTAAYHMPRSLLELRRAAPSITYLPHPVFPEQIRLQDWWRWPGTVELLVGEYHKYLAALVRAAAERRLRTQTREADGASPAVALPARKENG